MPRLVVIARPDPKSVLSTADAQAHLRITGDAAIVEQLVAAAFEQLDGPEGWLGRALATQTIELRQSGFPTCPGGVYLPCEPTRSIVSVTYDDVEGTEQVLDLSAYRLEGAHLQPSASSHWPRASRGSESVRIRYIAGYGDAANPTPATVVFALKLMVGRFYGMGGSGSLLKKKVVEGVGSREWDVTGKFDELADRAVTNLLSPLRIYQ